MTLKNQRPYRPHGNDAEADVYMPYDCTLQPGEIAKVPLGFGIEVPDGYVGYVFPHTSMAAKGLVCELPPVDSDYRREIHAIISNVSSQTQELTKGSRRGSACDHLGCHCGFCFGAWGTTGNRSFWQHREMTRQSGVR